MTEDRWPLAILFADIADSTSLYRTHGDQRAREIVLGCLNLVADVVRATQGTIVDRIGDELMCTFPSASAAAAAAIRIQEAVDEAQRLERAPTEVSVRIGFHFGPVLVDSGAVFGDTVHTAKRVATLAKARQVLTTAVTAHGLPAEHPTRFFDRARIKGKRDVFEVHEVLWNDSLQTVDAEPPHKDAATRHSELRLEFDSTTMTLDERHPVFTIGRGERCDFVLKDKGASRLHARIEYLNGKFVLTDVSRNGTTVTDQDGQVHYVHHDEYPLGSGGIIHFGTKESSGQLVRFQRRDNPSS